MRGAPVYALALAGHTVYSLRAGPKVIKRQGSIETVRNSQLMSNTEAACCVTSRRVQLDTTAWSPWRASL